MAIRICLDEVLRERHMTSKELCKWVGITEANLSVLRSGKAKGVRFGTLNKSATICSARWEIFCALTGSWRRKEPGRKVFCPIHDRVERWKQGPGPAGKGQGWQREGEDQGNDLWKKCKDSRGKEKISETIFGKEKRWQRGSLDEY